jgi:hypothetical protein
VEDELPLALIEEGAEAEVAAQEGRHDDEGKRLDEPAGVYNLGVGIEGIGVMGLVWGRGSGACRFGRRRLRRPVLLLAGVRCCGTRHLVEGFF